MSKSRGNVINPDDILVEYGADAFRLYEMFMGPLEMVKPWSTQGLEGVYRFLGRAWRLFCDEDGKLLVDDSEPAGILLKVLHQTIKKVGEDTDTLAFNTAVSQMMIFVNEVTEGEIERNPRLRPGDMVGRGGVERALDEVLRGVPAEGALAERDLALFEELVSRYQRQMYRVAYRLTGNDDDAQDLIQDALFLPLTIIDLLRISPRHLERFKSHEYQFEFL